MKAARFIIIVIFLSPILIVIRNTTLSLQWSRCKPWWVSGWERWGRSGTPSGKFSLRQNFHFQLNFHFLLEFSLSYLCFNFHSLHTFQFFDKFDLAICQRSGKFSLRQNFHFHTKLSLSVGTQVLFSAHTLTFGQIFTCNISKKWEVLLGEICSFLFIFSSLIFELICKFTFTIFKTTYIVLLQASCLVESKTAEGNFDNEHLKECNYCWAQVHLWKSFHNILSNNISNNFFSWSSLGRPHLKQRWASSSTALNNFSQIWFRLHFNLSNACQIASNVAKVEIFLRQKSFQADCPGVLASKGEEEAMVGWKLSFLSPLSPTTIMIENLHANNAS